MAEIFLGFLIAEVLQGVGPQQVAHGPEGRRLLEPVQLKRAEIRAFRAGWEAFGPAREELNTFLMSSKVCISGESPPWTHRNCWFMSAASGRQSNASMHAS